MLALLLKSSPIGLTLNESVKLCLSIIPTPTNAAHVTRFYYLIFILSFISGKIFAVLGRLFVCIGVVG